MAHRKGAPQASDILYSTLIGISVEILNSSQRQLVGLKGKIVDETKNLFVIETEAGKEVKIPKVSCVFRFFVDGETVDVDGRRIAFRHYERPKKVKRDAVLKSAI